MVEVIEQIKVVAQAFTTNLSTKKGSQFSMVIRHLMLAIYSYSNQGYGLNWNAGRRLLTNCFGRLSEM